MHTDANGLSRVSRRRFAALGAGALAGGLAGCTGNATNAGSTGDGDGNGDGYTVVASFFTFYDFADSLAEGTDVTVENLVPTGLHGHGWEPDPSIQRRITDADALVHVGPDFQPWVDRAIDALAAESTETALINARAGVDLIDLADSLTTEDEAVEGRRTRTSGSTRSARRLRSRTSPTGWPPSIPITRRRSGRTRPRSRPNSTPSTTSGRRSSTRPSATWRSSPHTTPSRTSLTDTTRRSSRSW